MIFRPKQKNRKAPILSISCAAGAVFLFAFSSYSQRAVMLYQLSALVLAVIAVELYLKFAASDYVYKADEKELKVFRVTGKKSICVCSLNYEESLLEVQTGAYFNEHPNEVPKTQISLNFCKTLFPEHYSLYFFTFNGKNASLKFEPDEVFTNYLNKKIADALLRVAKEEQDDE